MKLAIKEREWQGLERIGSDSEQGQVWAFLGMVLNFEIPLSLGIFLTICHAVRFSGRIVLHAVR